MKLTDRILIEHLQNQFQILFTKQIGLSGRLEGALLYRKGCVMNSGWVYIADSREILPADMQIPLNSLLIFAGPEEALRLPDGCACAGVNAEPAQVQNALTDIFHQYGIWEQKLIGCLLDAGSIGELMNASMHFFRNPLTLFSRNMSIVAQAFSESETEHSAVAAGREGDESDSGWLGFRSIDAQMELLTALMQDEPFRLKQSEHGCYEGPDYLIGYPTRMLNITDQNEDDYILSLAQISAPLTEADDDRMVLLGEYLQRALVKIPSEEHGSAVTHQLFQQILTDRKLDYLVASRHLTDLGWMPEHMYLCVVFELIDPDPKSMPVKTICGFLERQFRWCSSFPYQDKIVTYFNLGANARNLEAIEHDLKPFIRDMYLKAGYSRAVQGHMNLRRMYLQAKRALSIGVEQNPYRWIHHFDDVALGYMAEQLTRELPAEMVCHAGVLRLKSYDAEHGTDYVRTLSVWFENAQNAVHAAQALFIHRSTFLYRMDKIRQIMENALEDPNENIYIALSLYIMLK